MLQLNTVKELENHLKSSELEKKTIAFVPTMGALHDGHMKLIDLAKEKGDVVLCSIFVNPLQFNKKEDYDNYPNHLQRDLKLLQAAGCQMVFTPSKSDLFFNYEVKAFDYGEIGNVLEGQYRPGHFNGMLNVVFRFFEIIQPDFAIFGEKDYQQIALVRWMRNQHRFKTEIVEAKTVREQTGLALSSRNLRLAAEDLSKAQELNRCLQYCKAHKTSLSPEALKSHCIQELSNHFELDYFDIVDENTMRSIKRWEETSAPRALVAASISGIRLIDNLSLK